MITKLRVKALTKRQHLARMRELKAAGHRVLIVTLPNGTKVVLKSTKAGICHGGHCVKRISLAPRKKRRR